MRKNRRFLAIIMVLAFLGWSFNAQRVFADSEIPPEIQQEEQEVVDEEQNEEQPENNLEPESEEVIDEEPIEEEVIEEVIEEEIVEEIIEEEPIEEIVEEVPLAAPELPKTGGFAPELLYALGASLIATGLKIRKK